LRTSIRNLNKGAGSLKGGFKPNTNLCKGTTDETISNEEDTQNRWKTNFQDILNVTTAEHNTSCDNTHTNEIETEQELGNEPSYIFDIEIAIKSTRNNKA
jgi:hypothetical protein